jgi:glutamine synthetase
MEGSRRLSDELQRSVLKDVQERGISFINLQFTDIQGGLKSTTIPTAQLEDSLNIGTWFDGSSIKGFARIAESDMYLRPDPTTYAVIPWEDDVARIICDVYTPAGKPFEGDPRQILKRAMAAAAEMGYIYNTGTELEFFLFQPKNGPGLTPVPQDIGSYFDFSPQDKASRVRERIIKALGSFGLTVEMGHHEVAYGQHEIDFRYSNALTTADNAMTFKHTVKAVAQEHDLYATFMPKPVFGINGSGMHTHQSMFTKDGQNAFFDPEDEYKLSKAAKGFIAGQLAHVKEMVALLAPTVNSYKRLVPGYEAPVYISWARRNRSALIRVPAYSKGREKSTRAELRCPDPSCNPYLAFAAMLWSGLDGIKNNLKVPPPVEEDVYEFDDAKLKELYIDTLPASLHAAIKEMENSKVMKEALGKHTYEEYLKAKSAEWDDYRIQVTDWELKRYLETL